MIRLHFLVEGQTEEEFVKSTLAVHLGAFDVSADQRCVETGRSKKRAKIYRGGMTSYDRAKSDLRQWMKEDSRPDSYFTTMFDLYDLPDDWKGHSEATKLKDRPHERVELLEKRFGEDIQNPRFIPYIQLHEFEALLFADAEKLKLRFSVHAAKVDELVQLAAQFASPELIDDGRDTAPSKRIIAKIPEYDGAKASAGPLVAQKIGVNVMRARCPHFHGWLTRLEQLAKGTS